MKLERALIGHLYQELLKRNSDKKLTVSVEAVALQGPTAHMLFVQCLKEETEHSAH